MATCASECLLCEPKFDGPLPSLTFSFISNQSRATLVKLLQAQPQGNSNLLFEDFEPVITALLGYLSFFLERRSLTLSFYGDGIDLISARNYFFR